MKLTSWRYAYALIAIAITIISVLGLLRQLNELPPTDYWWPVSSRLEYLAIAISLAILQFTVAAKIYISALTPNETRMRMKLLGVFFLSQAGKYAPGRIWSPFIQKLAIGNGEKISTIFFANILVFSSVIISQIIIGLGALVNFLIGPLIAIFSMLIFFALSMSIASLLFSRNSFRSWEVFRFFSNQGNRIELAKNILLLLSIGLATWLSFYSGWLGYSSDEGLALVGATSLSIMIGYLSVLPAALGVRDAAFILMKEIPWPLPIDQMAVLAIQSRVFMFLVDGLTASLGLLVVLVARRQRS